MVLPGAREPPLNATSSRYRLLESLGLRAGDVILQINRQRIESAEQAAEVLRQTSGRLTVYIERNGEVLTRQLVRGSRG